MIRAHARDHFELVRLADGLPVEPRGLERRLGRLRAAAGEEERVDRRIHQRAELFRQLDRALVGAARVRRAERERAHLRPGRLAELLAPVADVHIPQAGEPVDVLSPGRVREHRAITRHPHARLGIGGWMMQRVKEMGLIAVERCVAGHATEVTPLRVGVRVSSFRGLAHVGQIERHRPRLAAVGGNVTELTHLTRALVEERHPDLVRRPELLGLVVQIAVLAEGPRVVRDGGRACPRSTAATASSRGCRC